MYIYAPGNYVYVAVQNERIDDAGDRQVSPIEVLSYHDSCWRTDGVASWVWKNRDEINTFSSFKILDWYDEVTLTCEEVECLQKSCEWKRSQWKDKTSYPGPHVFDKRGIWAGKE